jgi:hypothetical protein
MEFELLLGQSICRRDRTKTGSLCRKDHLDLGLTDTSS